MYDPNPVNCKIREPGLEPIAKNTSKHRKPINSDKENKNDIRL